LPSTDHKITREQFDNLSLEEQEFYINSGGKVLANTSGVVASSVSNTVQMGPSSGSSSSNEAKETPTVTSDTADTSNVSPSALPFSEGFDIDNPVQLLYLLDDDVKSGRDVLHPWQKQFMLDFADSRWCDDKPFHAIVRAANGSGKDKFCIAACAVWVCMKYKEVTCPITSSSGFQLDNQTCKHIKRLAELANSFFADSGIEIFKINRRYFECNPTKSVMNCYATDEPGKAEGFHPVATGRRMCIFMSEDKSIPDEIDNAIDRCSGYTHRVHASSPGNAYGHFYDLCQRATMRKDVTDLFAFGDLVQYHIPADKCPHIKPYQLKQIEAKDPNGKNGALYKSSVLAEFCVDYTDLIVLPFTYINIAKKLDNSRWIRENHNKAGLDLSDGGAETALVVRNGNKVIGIEPFKFDNTEDTIAYLCDLFKKWELVYDDSYIFGDCVGIGKPMLNRLKALGWKNIRFIDSRHRPFNPTVYKNYGTELWFNFAGFCKRKEIILTADETTCKQLATRYYKLVEGKIHQLLSKPEQRSKGYPSPDRADALVYAFADYKSPYKDAAYEESVLKPDENKTRTGRSTADSASTFTLKGWANRERKQVFNVEKPKDLSYIAEQLAQFNQNKIASKER